MEKRKALAAAGAVTITALAATAALGTNLGLFGLTGSGQDGPGSFAPVGGAAPATRAVPTERTEVVDVAVPYYVSDGGPDAASTDPTASGATPTGATVSGGTSGGASGGGSGGGSGSTSPASALDPTTAAPAGAPARTETAEAPTTESHEAEVHSTETTESRAHE